MINRIYIKNYKSYDDFELEFNDGINIIVGDNEAGKSTILEAVNLALTRRLNGKLIENELSPYLFNKTVTKEYIDSLKSDNPNKPPEILIELHMKDEPHLETNRGSMNSKRIDCIGIKLEIVFDEEYKEDYEELLKNKNEDLMLIPSEFYKVQWQYFSGNSVTFRNQLLRPSYIDATTIQLQSGTDYYLQDIIKNELNTQERVGLNFAYRSLKQSFAKLDSIKGINNKLVSKKGAITEKDLSISIDISQKTNWENNLIPHLDTLPFQLVGKGEQNALKIMLALDRKVQDSNIILIEEPENHLSFSSMNILVSKINETCKGKQIIITTHNTYVLNKLGLESLILLNDHKTLKLNMLTKETQQYFRILSGYDTLRVVLAKKAILVEGPSDELVVQKAYFQKYKRLPIEDGVDVINVRGLSFARFLDIAKELNKNVVVITDNDKDYENKVVKKYRPYTSCDSIKICSSSNNLLYTLELHLISCNSLQDLNEIFNKSFKKEDLLNYMLNNKTEYALRLFETNKNITFPEYVERAIE